LHFLGGWGGVCSIIGEFPSDCVLNFHVLKILKLNKHEYIFDKKTVYQKWAIAFVKVFREVI
jgi:hypothetical protein